MRNSTVLIHKLTWTLQISQCRSAIDWTLELLQHPLYCCFRMSVCARAALVNAAYACFGTEYGAVPTECSNKASSSFSHRWDLICWLSGMCSECLLAPRFSFVVLQMVCDVCQEAASTGPVYVEKLYWHIWLWGTCKELGNTGLFCQCSSWVFNTSPFSLKTAWFVEYDFRALLIVSESFRNGILCGQNDWILPIVLDTTSYRSLF